MFSEHKYRKPVFTGLVAAGIVATLAVQGLGQQPNQPRKIRYVFSFSGKRPMNPFPGENGTISQVALSKIQTEGRMTFLDEIWKKGFTVEPHFHKTHTEIFYVASGKEEWTIGGETHIVGPGDVVYIPPNTIHSVRVVGNEDVHSLMFQEPGGYEDRYIEQRKYTREQLKDPELNKRLDAEGDYYPVSDK